MRECAGRHIAQPFLWYIAPVTQLPLHVSPLLLQQSAELGEALVRSERGAQVGLPLGGDLVLHVLEPLEQILELPNVLADG